MSAEVPDSSTQITVTDIYLTIPYDGIKIENTYHLQEGEPIIK